MTSCSSLTGDPSYYGETAIAPDEEWTPVRSVWYCPREEPIPPPLVLPQESTEADLVALLDIALSNHPLTRQAWFNARAQAFEVGAVKSTYFPTIVGTEIVQWTDSKGAGGTSAQGGGGLSVPGQLASAVSTLSVSYLLLDFGGRESSVNSARQALYSLNWTQNRTMQQVIITAIQDYYGYINAKETVTARQEDLVNAQVNLDAAQALFESGLAIRLDVLQAEANVAKAHLNLVAAESQFKTALAQLATALALPPTTLFEVKDLPEYFPVDDVSEGVDQLLALAKQYRPDLAAAYATMYQREMDLRVAASAAYPNLTGNITVQQTSFFHHPELNGHFYNGAISLNVPIFSGFYYVNKIREAQEKLKSAKADFDNLELLALLDVVTSYYNFVAARDSLNYSEDYLKFSKEAYDVALESYRAGTVSILSLLSAQATLADARAQKIQARTQWAISLFTISYATGTLSTRLK